MKRPGYRFRIFASCLAALAGAMLLGLTACGTSASQDATDLATLANSVKAAVALYPAGTIPAAAVTYVDEFDTAANALAAAASGSAASASASSQLVTAAQALLPILATDAAAIPTVGPQIALALGAADVLLPVVVQELGGTTVASAIAPSPGVAALPVVSLADARAKYAPKAKSWL